MKKSTSSHTIRFALLIIFLVVSLSGCGGESGKPIDMQVLRADTTWSGNVIVKGDVRVARGVTLTIQPGTVVRFAKIEADGPQNLHKTNDNNFSRAELIVRGILVAQGTQNKRIVFTSAERSPSPGDWGAINFLDSRSNVIEHCEISYADTGLHGHGVEMSVKNCYVHDNGVAVAFNNKEEFRTSSVVNVVNSQIRNNSGGILCGKDTRSKLTNNEINNNELYGVFIKAASTSYVSLNDITGNGKGVLVYASRGARINKNNITDSVDYHISLLEGQRAGVNARNNWFGTTDASKIKARIWDQDEERQLGRVDFSGYAQNPIEGAGLEG